MADVFISYSRRDKAFVQKLHQTLAASNRDAWTDWEDIPPTAEWMAEIRAAIDAADTFAFVLSPDSMTSKVCAEEVAHAAKHHKRLVPLVCRDVDAKTAPAAVAALNWIFFRDSDDFEAAFQSLISALDTNLDWVRAHTRLLVRAIEWQGKKHNDSFVLRGSDLEEAERWIAQAAAKEPKPTALQAEYILASRKASTKRQRIALGAVTFGLLVAVVLGLVAYYQYQASKLRRQIAVSRQLAAQALATVDLDLALLLSVEAKRHFDSLEARSALLTGLQFSPHLVAFLHGHNESVTSVAFSPDGKTLVSASRDIDGSNGAVVLWSVSARKRLSPLPSGHTRGVETVAFSPDGTILASGSTDRSIILRDTTTRRPIAPPLSGHDAEVQRLVFSRDGRILASLGTDGTIILWDVATRQQLVSLPSGQEIGAESMALDPDATTLAVGTLSGSIALWDIASQQPLAAPISGHRSSVDSLTYSPDGKLLASGGADRTIILWDIATRRPIAQPLDGHRSDVRSIAFSPDGRMLASASIDKTIILWDVTTRRPLYPPLVGHRADVESVAFSPEGRMLASGGADKTVILWDVTAAYPLGQGLITHATPNVWSLAFSADGTTLALGDADNAILLWDVVAGKSLPRRLVGHEDRVRHASFNPDGTVLASSTGDNKIILWNITTGQPLGPPLVAHENGVQSLVFSPDGKTLASAGCAKRASGGFCVGDIRLWNVTTRQPSSLLLGHKDVVVSLAFSPDGRTLASGSWDKTIMLWDVASGGPLGPPLGGHSDYVLGLAFSPDGAKLASSSHAVERGNNIIFWNVATRQPLGLPLQGHTGGNVLTIAFSPHGRTLASGSLHGTLVLWDVETQQPIGLPILGDARGVRQMAFSSDGTTLATADGTNSLVRWDVNIDSWQQRACNIANRNLTRQEWQHYLLDEPYRETCPARP